MYIFSWYLENESLIRYIIHYTCVMKNKCLDKCRLLLRSKYISYFRVPLQLIFREWLINQIQIYHYRLCCEEEKLLWSLWMNETKDRHTFVHDVSFYCLIYVVGVIIAGGLGIHSHLSWLICREIPFWLGTFLQETSKNPFVDYRYLVLWCLPLLPREPFCEINFSFPFTIFTI